MGSVADDAEITGPLLAAAGGGGGDSAAAAGVERVPAWREQVTVRGIVVSAVLGVLFCLITHKLNLTVGVIPSLNVSAGLLGYFLVRSWTAVLGRLGFVTAPFTKQENTVIQTCVVACYGLAFSGGFGSYMLAMDQKTYELIGPDYPGNRAIDVMNPSLGWMIGFMFVVSFLGLFSLVALRKVMVIDYKLTYPSGTATAMLINSFHTTSGAELAEKQVSCLGKYLSISFFWNCFKWFFSGVGDSCGFDNFPSLGLAAFKNTPTYIGCGLICPHIVNCSTLLGAIISWGFLWPYISTKAGDWYPANLGSNDFKGLYGYKVFISVSVILGDGLYNLIKIIYATIKEVMNARSKQGRLPLVRVHDDDEGSKLSAEEKLRNDTFLKDRIPSWLAGSGYVGLAAISTATVPMIFPQVKWYLVLCAYVVAPLLAFCNSYGCGLTDWNLASTYGKIGLFIFASLVGRSGGVIAGLAACGVMMSIVSTAADLMQDFRTGYLTLSSPRSMFVSQLIGTTLGCIIAPLTFWLYWTAFDIGNPDGMFKAPYAVIYREMSILGVEGFSALPQHCLAICSVFFVAAILINLLRDVTPKSVSKFIPLPMAMAVPFYIGAYFAIDMFVGTVILFVWERVNRKESEDFAGAIASGLICGDGIWSVPSAILSIMRIDPPMCIRQREGRKSNQNPLSRAPNPPEMPPPETSSAAAPSPPSPDPLASPLLLHPREREIDPASPPPPPPPPWRDQLTLRGVAVAAVLGSLLCVVIHRLNLTVGVIPALNVASGLLAFFLATAWRGAAAVLGLGHHRGRPFTRQENTVIQTCAIACGSLAFSGCSSSYIFAMDRKTYELVGQDYPGNRMEDIRDPSLGWMIGFMFLIALIGPFSIVMLRKVMVIDYKLAFPGGTATALMINSLHGKTEADLAGRKVHCLVKYMSLSFGWSFFKWFFSGVGDSCGFDNFPSFGIEAFKNTFYFNFNPSYVGYGLISPHIVNCSVFLGSVISWGFLWPFIAKQAGDWYPDNLSNTDFRGLYGYKVFIAISVILGDGLYNLVKVFLIIAKEICNARSKEHDLPVQALLQDDDSSRQLLDEKLQTEIFLKDSIPTWLAVSGYIVLAAISTVAVPIIFPQLKWYLVLVCYFLAPAIAFCNSYGMGLTNLNLAPTYGKIALFVFASLVGSDGGVIAGLAACGVIMSIVCSAADLMQDFKSGYLTLSSPRSMFISQMIGVALGCIIAPLTLWLFWTAFDIGDPDGEYKAPFAIIFREMAIIGIEGFAALPRHCLEICCVFFLAALIINLMKDVVPNHVSRFIPIPMAMAVPFYIGAYFGVDMFIGTLILFAWQKIDRREADDYAVAVASGLICGDGVWSIPSAVLSILGVDPPICMSFRPSSASV
uniref:Metal-nicotianamine transporter YSL6 n=1 Tax=Oryza barthii TaxID=65489 RepID=A0A0D3FV63_9ORYZ